MAISTVVGAADFSVEKWESIIHQAVSDWEDRKREYQRWLAVGITSMVALGGVVLNTLPHVNLGPGPILTVSLVLLIVYVVTRAAYELLEGRIVAVLRVIVAGTEAQASPLQAMVALFKVGEVSPLRIALSPLGMTAYVTVLVWFLSLSSSPPIQSDLMLTAAWRSAVYLIGLVVLVYFRGIARKMLPDKADILKALPRKYPPERLVMEAKMDSFIKLGTAAYYGFQLWLLAHAMTYAAPVTYDLLLVTLLAIGVAVLSHAIRDPVWGLLKRSSEIFGRLRDLHSGIITGKLSTAGQISVEVAKFYQEMDENDREKPPAPHSKP